VTGRCAVFATAEKPDTSGVPERTHRAAALTPVTMATLSRSLLYVNSSMTTRFQ